MAKRLIVIIFILGAIAWLFVWAHKRLTNQDQSLSVTEIRSGSAKSPAPALKDVSLTWCTTANVPLSVTYGGKGYGLLQVLGVPESVQADGHQHQPRADSRRLECRGHANQLRRRRNGSSLYGSRRNLAALQSHSRRSIHRRHEKYRRQAGRARIDVVDKSIEYVAESRSLERMPSISRDGASVVFHSFRDGEPGGDLYLATLNPATSDWDVKRLTQSPGVEYVWPEMDTNENAVIAIERPLGQQVGKVILWKMEGGELSSPQYLTDDLTDVRFPSLNAPEISRAGRRESTTAMCFKSGILIPEFVRWIFIISRNRSLRYDSAVAFARRQIRVVGRGSSRGRRGIESASLI